MSLFFVIVITITSAVHWLLYSRFVAAFSISSPGWLWTFRGLFAFLAFSYLTAHLLERLSLPAWLLTAQYWLASIWIGLMLQFLWMSLLAVLVHLTLLATGVWQRFPLEQQMLISRSVGIGAIAVAVVLCGYAIWRADARAAINEYAVPAKNITPELSRLKIVHVADFHAGMLIGPERLGRMIDQVQALKPDLILIPGDIVDASPALLKNLIPVFARLEAPLGVFGSTGNHEYYIGVKGALKLLEQCGITMLNNRGIELPNGLVIAGMEDRTARQMGLPRPTVEAVLGETAREKPFILLDHTPATAEVDAATSAGADLVLCGHTHGGQLWPFTYLVRATFKYFHGMYNTTTGTVITTCGIGYWGPPMRLGAPPEINVIRLVAR